MALDLFAPNATFPKGAERRSYGLGTSIDLGIATGVTVAGYGTHGFGKTAETESHIERTYVDTDLDDDVPF